MGVQDEIDGAAAVAAAAQRVRRTGRTGELTLANGIVIGARSVPPLLGDAIQREFPEPKPPIWRNEEKGRDEENFNDPTYQRELETWNERNRRAIADLILVLGTYVVSVPEGLFAPEDDGWIEQVEKVGKFTGKSIEIKRDDADFRYIAWLRLYALETMGDIALLTALPGELSNLTENEVDEAMAGFRGLPERRADPGPPAPDASTNGHRDNRAARRTRSGD